MAYPPSTQEYSYGFTPTVFDFGEMNGRKVRFLRRVKVHEVSPVLLGAGVNTRTIELRDHGPGSTKRGTSMQHPPVFDPYRAEKKLEHVRAYLLESKFRQFERNTAEAAQVKYREVNVDLWMLDATYLLSHLCSEELGVKAAEMRFFRKALPSDQVAFTFPSDVLWGLASPIERRIWIREDRRGTNLIRAVAHEMRHLAQPLATDKDSRALDEDDAESYADDFSSRFGRVPTSARLYVNLFEKKRLNAIEPDAPAGSGLINVVDGWLYARDSYGWRKIRRWKKEN